MAERTRSTTQRPTTAKSDSATPGVETSAAQQRSDEAPREGAVGGGWRTTRLSLPFMSAEFRTPDVHVPGRHEMAAAARVVGSVMPSPTTALYYGGLAVTAALGAIEWPVAAAIGVGTALASKGKAAVEPRGAQRPAGRDETSVPGRA